MENTELAGAAATLAASIMKNIGVQLGDMPPESRHVTVLRHYKLALAVVTEAHAAPAREGNAAPSAEIF